MRRFFMGLAVVYLAVVAIATHPVAARADVVIAVNKSTQSMTVAVNGRELYHWPVSTGVGGGPPSGQYQPERLERTWYSRRYNWSPMPHAIFFHQGYAIHGTYYVSRLGQPASHGCVRLHPSHAAALFALVRGEGMGRTHIFVSNGGRYADGRR